MKSPTVLVWLSNNLRLDDNAALSAASEHGAVVPVFIHDDSSKSIGGASKWWLRESLHGLAGDLAKQNIQLVLRHGDSLVVLRSLITETGAKTVMASKRYEPVWAERDAQVAAALRADGIEVVFHTGFLLFEPQDVRTQSGTPFKVFTPFSRACFSAPSPPRPLSAPQNICGLSGIASEDLNSWELVSKTAQWPDGLKLDWDVSETSALAKLHEFVNTKLVAYKTARDRPDVNGTSRLSPYLHFGNISPRRIWHTVMAQDIGAEKYLQEILWREFSWHLLAHIPDFTRAPLLKSFVRFPWRDDDVALKTWQRGLTGYPIVDAGMRQLWQTGWMHNRVRMIVASFLIKDLLIDWQRGAEWFWDTLVDADLGSNTASWQWVAGCGADAAPYFRIFNPILQGQKFDPNGDYVRRFVPELSKLDTKFIHEPWKAPPDLLSAAGIVNGKTYPLPMIDHGKARQRALNALKTCKNEAEHGAVLPDLFD